MPRHARDCSHGDAGDVGPGGDFDEAAPMIVNALKTGFIEGDGKFYKQPRTEIRPRPQHSFDGRIYAVGVERGFRRFRRIRAPTVDQVTVDQGYDAYQQNPAARGTAGAPATRPAAVAAKRSRRVRVKRWPVGLADAQR